MNMQEQRLFDTRGFRIAAIAVAAAVVLGVAAYFFGTGLRADTSASVAPSPLGSSLTAIRERSSEDYVGRLINAAAAARETSLAALTKSRSDFHAELNSSAAASRAASAAGRFADRYDRMNSSSAAVSTALLEMIERSGSANYSERAAGLWFDIPAAGTMAIRPAGPQSSAGESSAAVSAAMREMIERSGSANYSERAAGLWYDIPAAGTMAIQLAGSESRNVQPSAAVRGASLAELARIWAPFYAGLDKAMTDAGARPAQGTSSRMLESSTEGRFQWVKPEGVKPSEAADPAAEQNPWIKPEGIRSK